MSDGKKHTVRVGVFIPAQAQMLDVACVDLLGIMSHEYLEAIKGMMPGFPTASAPNMQIAYIGSVKAGEPIKLTANMSIVCTHHMSDPEVRPGELDVVIVPGPDPGASFSPETGGWLRAHGERTDTTDILSVCTGIFLCGEAGLLDGKQASGPRWMQDQIKQKFPKAKLVGDELRYIQDGNLWSCGKLENAPSNPPLPTCHHCHLSSSTL